MSQTRRIAVRAVRCDASWAMMKGSGTWVCHAVPSSSRPDTAGDHDESEEDRWNDDCEDDGAREPGVVGAVGVVVGGHGERRGGRLVTRAVGYPSRLLLSNE